tara:strand:- start:17025 stop:17975 length:951 start_codon:yes stop_codon:yes gene_type:complete
MSSESEKTSLVLFYSTALLIFAETLILRAVPQLFPILATIPLIFVGQILNQRFFILSLIITNSTFFVLSFSEFNLNQIYFSKRFFINFFISSILVFSLFYFLKLNLKKKINDEKVLIFLTFFVLFVLLLFNFLYFYRLDHKELNDFLVKFFSKIIEGSGSSIELSKTNIIETVVRLIPSINAFILLTSLILNFFLTDLILKKLNILKTFSLGFKKFNMPQTLFLIFNIIFFLSILVSGEIKFHLITSVIVFSFLLFYQGLIYFSKFFEKYNLNIFLKILIIFLLFIFLGYVLFLTIFIVGYIINLKSIFIKGFKRK